MAIKIKKLAAIKENHIFPVFLLVILATHFISSYYILTRSRILIYWDEFTRYGESYSFYNAQAIEFLKQFFQLRQEWQYHPHFFAATAALFWKFLSGFGVFSDPALRILVPNTFFLGVLLASVYGIIKQLYEDEAMALLGTLLLSFLPVVYLRYRVYMIDFPLMAMVCLSVFVLIKFSKVQSAIFSLACGIILWLGEMTKEIFILFILPVILVNFYHLWKQRSISGKKIIFNFCLMFFTFSVLSLFVYLPFWGQAIPRYFSVPFFQGEWKFGHLIYGHAFVWTYFHPLLFLSCLPFFILGLVRSGKFAQARSLLFFWIVPAFFLVSFVPNREARYLLAIIPAFVIASVAGIQQVSFYRRYFVIFIVSVAMFQWYILTFNPGFLNYYSTISHYEKKFVNKDRVWEKGVAGISDELGQYHRIIDDIIELTKPQGVAPSTVYSFISASWASCQLPLRLMFSNINTKLSVPFFWGDQQSFQGYRLQEKEEGLTDFKDADFILLSTPLGKVWLGSVEQREYFMRSRELFLKEKQNWDLCKIFKLDNEVIELYRRR